MSGAGIVFALGELLAAPSPSDGEEFTPVSVSPGLAGFFAMFVLAVAVVLLAVDMTRRTRRVQARARVQERMAAEERRREDAAEHERADGTERERTDAAEHERADAAERERTDGTGRGRTDGADAADADDAPTGEDTPPADDQR
ncbi:hypothetical protein [Brachybacterium vulturis]|uniref:hypothetical protein n=1 Tax=Brachybacterium vulturis TaxID=2017484 RepID=UPI0012FE5E03|nr:hypothetical protein [Brachybacterium vulturis]